MDKKPVQQVKSHGIVILHAVVRDFNLVWRAYVSDFSPCALGLITVQNPCSFVGTLCLLGMTFHLGFISSVCPWSSQRHWMKQKSV